MAEAISSVQVKSAEDETAGTTLVITLDAAPQTGHAVALMALFYQGSETGTTLLSVVDGNSNAYTLAGESTYVSGGGQIHGAYLESAPANAHATITLTFNATCDVGAVWVQEISAASAITFEHWTEATGSGNITTPNADVDGDNRYAIGAFAQTSSGHTVNSPWTQLDAAHFGNAAFYDIDVDADQAADVTTANNWTCAIMTFVAAGTPPAEVNPLRVVTGARWR